MKRIISFSLWGTDPLYNRGAIENVADAREAYPGWICRFYADPSSPAIPELEREGAEVFLRQDHPFHKRALWRFEAASDHEVEYAIFRDCDSRVNAREAAAVQEWIASKKDAHIMKDHPAHTHWDIQAGMWGVKGGILTDMPSMVRKYIDDTVMPDLHATDQLFLKLYVIPKIKKSVLCHGLDEPLGPFFPFPAHGRLKYGMRFVGEKILVEGGESRAHDESGWNGP